jgi:hypothetical protein
MSQINDALNKAKQAAPRNLPNALPPMQPVGNNESSPAAVWLVPAIVIFLIVAAIFFIGWAAAHNTVHDAAVAQQSISATQQVETTRIDTILQNTNNLNSVTDAPAPVPVYMPKLQGIFYSATAPTAILDGKTVAPGDQFGDYKVKAITKYTVILVGKDKKEITVGMGE